MIDNLASSFALVCAATYRELSAPHPAFLAGILLRPWGCSNGTAEALGLRNNPLHENSYSPNAQSIMTFIAQRCAFHSGASMQIVG